MDAQIGSAVAFNRKPRMTTFNVAEEFTDEPGGRFYSDGDGSGEEFRDEHLTRLVNEALESNEVVTINFDGVWGIPTSFSEEAFGGMIRHNPQWPAARVFQLVHIEAPKSPKLWAYVAFAQQAFQRAVEKAQG